MIELPLTRGYTVQVEDSDAESLRAWKWTYMPRSNGRGGYAVRWATVDGKKRTIYMHRHIMQARPGQLVDHEDGNGLNNQRYNLRLSTDTQNRANSQAPVRTIPYRGVYAETRGQGRTPYFAQIKAFRRCWRLGGFVCQEDAARAYDRAALHFFGSFARLNFPDEREQTRALPLAPVIVRRLESQPMLPHLDGTEPWPAGFEFPAPTLLRPVWAEIQAEQAARRAAIVPAVLADDWDEGLL
jgi:hypothetical protein